jgi:hypothetical protein
MKTKYAAFFFLLLFSDLSAQTDSVLFSQPLSISQRISQARSELRESFLRADHAEAGIWIEALNGLENETYIGLSWDERWLLYYWADNFGALLAEASVFGANERSAQAYKEAPSPDSLFEIIDAAVYEQRFAIFQKIQQGFLSAEEKAFASLLLEYLLRLNTDEADFLARKETFGTAYPNSKFNYFLKSIQAKNPPLVPANKGFGISGHFVSGTWSRQLERSLNPLFAAQFDLYYWVDRWNLSATTILGGQKLARDIPDGSYTWLKRESSNFFSFGVEVGYDFINNNKVRLFPAIGGAVASLRPPAPGDDASDEELDVYDNFSFLEAHLSVSLTADAKLFGKNPEEWGAPTGSYHGVRLRVGYNWLNFKGQNYLLEGNMFYIAVGYNLFAFKEAKK